MLTKFEIPGKYKYYISDFHVITDKTDNEREERLKNNVPSLANGKSKSSLVPGKKFSRFSHLLPAYVLLVFRLINTSAFPPVFTLYLILVWGVLLCLSMFSGFDLPKPI